MNVDELTEKKKEKLLKTKEKYKVYENLIIARTARKTLRYIEKYIFFRTKRIFLRNI